MKLCCTLTAVTIDEAFATVSNCFPQVAQFQGIHFKYAIRNGVTLVERKGHDRFYYWLSVDDHFLLINASQESKLAPMRTIGQSLKPNPQ
jgi:hypothetical protein